MHTLIGVVAHGQGSIVLIVFTTPLRSGVERMEKGGGGDGEEVIK